MPDLDWVDWTSQPDPYDQGRGRRTGGRSALDMLTSSVDHDGESPEEPGIDEDLWYPTEDLVVGPGDALDTDPDQEGPT